MAALGLLLGGTSSCESSVSKLGDLRFLYTVPEGDGRSSSWPEGTAGGGEEGCSVVAAVPPAAG